MEYLYPSDVIGGKRQSLQNHRGTIKIASGIVQVVLAEEHSGEIVIDLEQFGGKGIGAQLSERYA